MGSLLASPVTEAMPLGIVSGIYDPITPSEIEFINEVYQTSSEIIVIVHSDEYIRRNYGRPLMPLEDRVGVVSSIYSVDRVIPASQSDDQDNTVIPVLEELVSNYDTNMVYYFDAYPNSEIGTQYLSLKMRYPGISFSTKLCENNKTRVDYLNAYMKHYLV